MLATIGNSLALLSASLILFGAYLSIRRGGFSGDTTEKIAIGLFTFYALNALNNLIGA